MCQILISTSKICRKASTCFTMWGLVYRICMRNKQTMKNKSLSGTHCLHCSRMFYLLHLNYRRCYNQFMTIQHQVFSEGNLPLSWTQCESEQILLHLPGPSMWQGVCVKRNPYFVINGRLIYGNLSIHRVSSIFNFKPFFLFTWIKYKCPAMSIFWNLPCRLRGFNHSGASSASELVLLNGCHGALVILR